mgnify:CR=1 FL=1
MLKNFTKYILQKTLGLGNYLFLFSIFKFFTLHLDKKERDFIYFLNMIPDKGAVLDIGANIGIMTSLICKKLKDTRVFAFEPLPYNISALLRVITFFNFKNVRVLETALGNEKGTAVMALPVINKIKMQGLAHIAGMPPVPDETSGELFTVAIIPLDEVEELMNDKISISAIKIDVENFEYQVLLGGKNLITRHKPLIYMELWDNDNRKNCFKLLEEIGYSANVFENKKPVPFDKEKHLTQNFIFICKKSF